jgi:hypothetical protein
MKIESKTIVAICLILMLLLSLCMIVIALTNATGATAWTSILLS